MQKWLRSVVRHLLPTHDNAYRPGILHREGIALFLAVLLTAEAFFIGNLVVRQSGSDFLAAIIGSEIVSLTNSERSHLALGELRENAQLAAAAQAKANDMATRGYFSHTGPGGEEPWTWVKGAGYAYRYAGENLAVRFVDSSEVVEAWMASPSHRANIAKDKYQEIGVGVAQGTYQGAPATFVVQFFGSPALASNEGQPPPVATQNTSQTAPAAATQVSTTKTPTPAVAGAEVASEAPAAPVLSTDARSFANSFPRAFLKAFAEPRTTTAWALGVTAAVLGTILLLTFFVRMQVQPIDLILPGVVLLVVSVSLLGFNSFAFSGGAGQSAAVAQAVSASGVVVGEAASVEQTLLVLQPSRH